ncbi:MAG: hypothetical protein IPP47_28030 [Bryobacterales bacterium]|nr:hypothetical protein [Bryobacterales bacterium]
MHTLGSAKSLSTLRGGNILTANSNLDLQLSATAPVSFDLHWLRSLGSVLLGATGIRVDVAAAAQFSISLSAHCTATVHRQDRSGQDWLRLSLTQDRALSATPSFTVRAALTAPQAFDPLHLALAGDHPRQRLRSLLKSIGGPTVSTFLQESGVDALQFASLAALWPNLTAATEPVLWHAAQVPAHLDAIASFTRWLASECPSATALQAHLLPASPVVSRWFEALTAAPASSCLPDSAFLSAQAAARACLPLLQWPELPALLRQLLVSLPATSANTAAPVRDLARRLYDAAGPALARALSAELSLRLSASAGRSVLLDAAFRMDDSGLNLYRHALAGNISPLFTAPQSSVEIYTAALGHSLLRHRTLELHLPFLASTSQSKDLASITSAHIATGAAGRLTLIRPSAQTAPARNTSTSAIHNEQQSRMIISASLSAADREPVNDNFSLTFTDTRVVGAGQDNHSYLQVLASYGIRDAILPASPARANLTLTLPGAIVQDWTRIPLNRSELLAPILARVSLTLQATLRRWLPLVYLSDPARYSTPAVVLPLLAYQFSQPFARVGLRQYSYDAMDPASVLAALNSALPRLKAPLARIQALLDAIGKPTLAARYDSESLPAILRAILNQQRHFSALLTADSFFIEQVLALARYNRDLSTTATRNPAAAARDLQRFTTDFVSVFHRRLSRLYGGQEFTALGSLLLIEATAALFGRRDAIQANWTIEPIPSGPAT